MIPAIPTPFDIIPPPPPLWIPSTGVWLTLSLLFIGTIIFLIMRRKKTPPPLLGYRELLLSDIRHCIAHQESADLEHVVQLALRTLSYTIGEELSSESAAALKHRASSVHHPLIAELLEKVASSKDLLYAPHTARDSIILSARSLAVSAEQLLSTDPSREPSE